MPAAAFLAGAFFFADAFLAGFFAAGFAFFAMGFLGPEGADVPDTRVRVAGRWVALSAPYGVAWLQTVRNLTVFPIGGHPKG